MEEPSRMIPGRGGVAGQSFRRSLTALAPGKGVRVFSALSRAVGRLCRARGSRQPPSPSSAASLLITSRR
eukprot:7634207-Pyramimonas_sp.AAC.1